MKKILIILSFVVYYSATAQWAPINFTESMSIKDIHFIDEQIGFAAGYHEVYKTTNGGQNWTEIASDEFVNGPNCVWFINENIGFIIGDDGWVDPVVSKTINGGSSWTKTTLTTSSNLMKTPSKIFFLDSNTGFISCRGGYLFKTTNQGVVWNELATTITDDLSSIHFPTSNIGYVSISYSSSILKTINGGNSWTLLNLGQLIGVNDLYFTDESTGYLACGNSKILKTEDGGSSWDVFDFGTNDNFYAITFTSKNIGYVAGASGTLVTTTDAGSTWQSNTSGVSQLLYRIDFPTQEVGYISSLHNPPVIIKTTNGGGILSVAEPKGKQNFTLYPNPASDLITIMADKSLLGSKFLIINQLGRTVLSGTLTGNVTTVSIDELTEGVYLFQLGERKWQSLKFIKK